MTSTIEFTTRGGRGLQKLLSPSSPPPPHPTSMASKTTTWLFLIVSMALPQAFACDSCSQPSLPWPPALRRPPRVLPPVEGGGGLPGASPPATCSLDHLKLGLCLDVLGGLVHLGAGNPAENVCCPVLHGLLELEAAVCLCTAIKLRILNLDIYIPLALQLLITCGKNPPSGSLCPLN
ncbi:unnamed protein product [Musa acuminata subsp. burmannicoides]